jgi:hypothetical protein
MKRLLLLTQLGGLLASSTGCCIIDRLFHCPCGRWRGGGCGPGVSDCAPCAGCNDPGCGYAKMPQRALYADGEPMVDDGAMYAGGPGPGGCQACAHGKCGLHGARAYAAPQGPPGPLTGQVAYPYYTTRGPRDFLARNPPDIGP